MKHLRKLVDHLVWADTRVLEGLRTTAGSDPRALELYAHVLGAEHVWLSRISGKPTTVAVWPMLTLDGCARLAAENVAALRRLLADATPEWLTREVTYTNSAGRTYDSKIDDILLHVALHGTYHRGQVALIVRMAGGIPAPTDYIAFVRGDPAATRVSGERPALRG
jgi:uncharacterized damage-inducible protein DinB